MLSCLQGIISKGGLFMKYKICLVLVVMSLGSMIQSVAPTVEGLKSEALQREYMPGEQPRLRVVSIESDTDYLEFKVFSGYRPALGLVLPRSTLHIIDNQGFEGVDLTRRDILMIQCTKGSYRSVYIQDGHRVSGEVEEGWDGPFSIEMWLPYPFVSDVSKVHIRYAIKKGTIGKIGVKIGAHGDYRLVAVQDVQFIREPDKIEVIEEDEE